MRNSNIEEEERINRFNNFYSRFPCLFVPIYGQPFFTSEAEVERSSKGDTGPIEKYTIKSRVYFFVIYLVAISSKGQLKWMRHLRVAARRNSSQRRRKYRWTVKSKKKKKINKNKQLKCRIESFHNLIKFQSNSLCPLSRDCLLETRIGVNVCNSLQNLSQF